MQAHETAKVAEHWGQTPPDLEHSFYTFPPLRGYFYSCLTGRPAPGSLPRDWLEQWVIDTFLADVIPVEQCLSLCCGFGEIERILAQKGVFSRCTGMDISSGALAEATRQAQKQGLGQIEYVRKDLNREGLESNRYDLVWANGALHHLGNLEHAVDQIHRALKPGGILIAVEYVGPRHQQLPPRQLELINAAIHLIPPRLRAASEAKFVPPALRRSRWKNRLFRLLTGRVGESPSWPRWKRAIFRLYRRYQALLRRISFNEPFRFGKVLDNDPWYFQSVDPSEGVRSDEILPTLRRTFPDLEIRYWNCSLIRYTLDATFFREFDPRREEDALLLDMLIGLERTLVATKELEPESATVIARKAART